MSKVYKDPRATPALRGGKACRARRGLRASMAHRAIQVPKGSQDLRGPTDRWDRWDRWGPTDRRGLMDPGENGATQDLKDPKGLKAM